MKLYREDFTGIPKDAQASIEELADEIRILITGQENRIAGIALCAILAEVIAQGSLNKEELAMCIAATGLSITGRAEKIFRARQQK